MTLTRPALTLADQYFEELAARHYAKNTLRLYGIELRQWALFCRMRGVNVAAPPEDLVQKYLTHLNSNTELAEVTVCHKLRAITLFYKWAAKNSLIAAAPKFPEVRPPPSRLPRLLSTEEIDLMLAACARTYYGVRRRAIIETLYCSGCRVSELVSLKLADVDFARCCAVVYGSKSKRERVLSLGERAVAAIRDYLEFTGRTAQMQRQDAPLFATAEGGPLSENRVRTEIRKAGQVAGILRRCHPHMLRHSYATHLVAAGVDVETVRKLLGHANLASTQIYVHVTSTGALESVAQHHPHGRAKAKPNTATAESGSNNQEKPT